MKPNEMHSEIVKQWFCTVGNGWDKFKMTIAPMGNSIACFMNIIICILNEQAKH